MSNDDSRKKQEVGIAGLPKKWGVVVQLVGTFGLAVFLVLYYVIILHPKEVERYESLSASVQSLRDVIVSQQSLVTRTQSSKLDELFVMALSHEVANIVVRDLPENPTVEALGKSIEEKLIFETRLLEGLQDKDGRSLSEMLTHKIRNSEISFRIADQALSEWRGKQHSEIARYCKDAMYFSIKRAAREK